MLTYMTSRDPGPDLFVIEEDPSKGQLSSRGQLAALPVNNVMAYHPVIMYTFDGNFMTAHEMVHGADLEAFPHFSDDTAIKKSLRQCRATYAQVVKSLATESPNETDMKWRNIVKDHKFTVYPERIISIHQNRELEWKFFEVNIGKVINLHKNHAHHMKQIEQIIKANRGISFARFNKFITEIAKFGDRGIRILSSQTVDEEGDFRVEIRDKAMAFADMEQYVSQQLGVGYAAEKLPREYLAYTLADNAAAEKICPNVTGAFNSYMDKIHHERNNRSPADQQRRKDQMNDARDIVRQYIAFTSKQQGYTK